MPRRLVPEGSRGARARRSPPLPPPSVRARREEAREGCVEARCDASQQPGTRALSLSRTTRRRHEAQTAAPARGPEAPARARERARERVTLSSVSRYPRESVSIRARGGVHGAACAHAAPTPLSQSLALCLCALSVWHLARTRARRCRQAPACTATFTSDEAQPHATRPTWHVEAFRAFARGREERGSCSHVL